MTTDAARLDHAAPDDEQRWHTLACDLIDQSRALLVEATATLRWMRSAGGPLWRAWNSGHFDDPDAIPSFRTVLRRLDAGARLDGWVNGATTLRLVRRYRSLARTVARTQHLHHAAWWTPPPGREPAP